MGKTKLYFKNGKTYFKSGGRFHELPKAQASASISDIAGQDLTAEDNMSTYNAMGLAASQNLKKPSQFEGFMKNYGNAMSAALPALLSAIPEKDTTIKDPFVASRMPTENNQIASGLSSGLDAASQFLGPIGQAVNLGRNVLAGVGNKVADAFSGKTRDVISTLTDPTELIANLIEDPRDLFGTKKREKLEKYQEEVSRRSDEIKTMNAGTNKGNVYTHGIYAKTGKNILTEPSKNIKKPNVEIEHDEIYLGNPGNVTKYDDATTSLTSKYATKFHGDWHGEDTDKDGMEGIPLNAPDGYIASNYLGLDGRPVKGQKDSKKTGKTVADEMTPLIKFLHDAEQNPKDLYKNNPAAIKQVLKQLEKMKNTAEKNKFREELIKMLRDKQGFDFESILAFIQENAPVEDMTPEEQQALQQIVGGGQEQQMPQQGGQELSPEMIQQMMAEQGQQTLQAKYGKSMNNYYKRYQQGGMTPEQMMQMQQQAQPQEQPNKSSERMAMLLDQARMATGQGPMNPSVDQMGDQDVKEMFNALPNDVKEMIINLPVDQQEMAIISNYETMIKQQQAMAAQGQQQMMEGEAEMEESGMSPEDVAATAEEQILEMMYGGQLPKHQKEGYIKPLMYNTPKTHQEPIKYNKATFKPEPQYIDAYTAAAEALGLTKEQIAQQLNKQKQVNKRNAADQLIKSIPSLFNNNDEAINALMKKYNQMEMLNNNAGRDAIIEQEIEKAMMLDKEMSKQKGYKYGGELPKHQKEGYINNSQTVTAKAPTAVDPYMTYIESEKKKYGITPEIQTQISSGASSLPIKDKSGIVTGKKYKLNDGEIFVPTFLTRDEFAKQQLSKPSTITTTMASKANGGYPDSTINRPGYTNEYFGDKFKGGFYYQDGGQHDPFNRTAHLRPGFEDKFNPLMGNNVDPYSAFGEQGDSRGNNGVTTFDNRRKFESELAKSMDGGMIGKTIKYKKGGQLKTGKVVGISKTGKYIVK